MQFLTSRPATPPLPAIALWLLAALWLLTGNIGHDPWKTEDAIHIGIAFGFARDGYGLVPQVAGEVWLHTAPLYHWVAAGLGRLLGELLPFHDAARLATSLFGAIYLLALGAAARTAHGAAAGRIAPLVAIGTLGLLLPLHEAQPAVAGLACAALAYWGASLLQADRRIGCLWLGLGIGLAFPAHGLAGLVMVAAVLPAPILRRRPADLLLTLVIALPLAAAWPLALYQSSPEQWLAWWQNEFAEATRARGLPENRHWEQILWATWPALPLALWSLWLLRRESGKTGFSLLGIAIALFWFLSGSSRLLALLPLMTPLILLAAAGTDSLRRGAANAFDWFALMTFSFAAGLIWLGASAQALDWPPQIARNFEKLAPGFQPDYSPILIAAAVAATLAWLLIWRLPRAGWRASLHWAAGATLMWVLVVALWMDWIDHGKSYRGVALGLQAALPSQARCLDRIDVSSTQRASLDYFTGLRTSTPQRGRACGWRLVVADRERTTPAGWKEVWRGNRPSDRRERWILERLLPPAEPKTTAVVAPPEAPPPAAVEKKPAPSKTQGKRKKLPR